MPASAGRIGVVEGNGGRLRAGLPWQSVHDGDDFVHEPLRLSVCIGVPRMAMSDILKRHQGICALFDHRWLHLFAVDDRGRIAWRYAGDLEWMAIAPSISLRRRSLFEQPGWCAVRRPIAERRGAVLVR